MSTQTNSFSELQEALFAGDLGAVKALVTAGADVLYYIDGNDALVDA